MKRILVGNFSFSFFISFRHADRLFITSCFFNSTMQSLGVRLSSLGWLLLEVTQKNTVRTNGFGRFDYREVVVKKL